MTLVQPRDLFSLGRANADFDYQHMALQLPLLGVAWVVLALALLRSTWRTSWYRVIVLLARGDDRPGRGDDAGSP